MRAEYPNQLDYSGSVFFLLFYSPTTHGICHSAWSFPKAGRSFDRSAKVSLRHRLDAPRLRIAPVLPSCICTHLGPGQRFDIPAKLRRMPAIVWTAVNQPTSTSPAPRHSSLRREALNFRLGTNHGTSSMPTFKHQSGHPYRTRDHLIAADSTIRCSTN